MVCVPHSGIFKGEINVRSSGSFVGTSSLQLSHTYPTQANAFTHNHKAAKLKIENILPSKKGLAVLLIVVNFYL